MATNPEWKFTKKSFAVFQKLLHEGSLNLKDFKDKSKTLKDFEEITQNFGKTIGIEMRTIKKNEDTEDIELFYTGRSQYFIEKISENVEGKKNLAKFFVEEFIETGKVLTNSPINMGPGSTIFSVLEELFQKDIKLNSVFCTDLGLVQYMHITGIVNGVMCPYGEVDDAQGILRGPGLKILQGDGTIAPHTFISSFSGVTENGGLKGQKGTSSSVVKSSFDSAKKVYILMTANKIGLENAGAIPAFELSKVSKARKKIFTIIVEDNGLDAEKEQILSSIGKMGFTIVRAKR